MMQPVAGVFEHLHARVLEMRDAAVYLESIGISSVDINMGCPVRKVCRVGGGSAMMTERQRKFREAYKADISPLYSGLLHITVMYGVGIAAIAYCLTQIQGATWEWLLIVPVFLAGNFVEWFMHRYVMHRRIDVFALRRMQVKHPALK